MQTRRPARLAACAALALLAIVADPAGAAIVTTSASSSMYGFVAAGGNTANGTRGSSSRAGDWSDAFNLLATDGPVYGTLYASGGLDLSGGANAGVTFGGEGGVGGPGSSHGGFTSSTRFTVSGASEPITYEQNYSSYGSGTVLVSGRLKGPTGYVFAHNDLLNHSESMFLPVGDYEFSYELDVTAGAGVYVQPIGSGDLQFTNAPCIVITHEPESDLTQPLGTAPFHVVAQASGTVNYQWRRNGVALSDSTDRRSGTHSADFYVMESGPYDKATYDCVVSAACGSLTSATVQLAISPGSPPFIVTQPFDINDNLDNLAVEYSITAVSAVPGMTFQWQIGNVALSDGQQPDGAYFAGTSSNLLTIAHATPAEFGAYTCKVTNDYASVTSGPYHLVAGETGVSAPLPPTRLALGAPANPARGPVALRFTLPREGAARLGVYEAGGRRVALLVDGDLAAGEHTITWDGRGPDGQALPVGVVWCALEQGGARVVRMLVMLH